MQVFGLSIGCDDRFFDGYVNIAICQECFFEVDFLWCSSEVLILISCLSFDLIGMLGFTDYVWFGLMHM